MDCSIALEYFESITVIEAQRYLIEMNITDYPRMKNDGRRQFHRDMRKTAHPKELQKLIEFEDFIERMSDGR